MSLEAALKENTEAAKALTAALLKRSGDTASASKKGNTAEKQDAAEKGAGSAQVEQEPKVTEVQLTNKIKEVAKKFDQPTAKAIFTPLGYVKMVDIEPKDYDAIYAACEKKLTEEEDL